MPSESSELFTLQSRPFSLNPFVKDLRGSTKENKQNEINKLHPPENTCVIDLHPNNKTQSQEVFHWGSPGNIFDLCLLRFIFRRIPLSCFSSRANYSPQPSPRLLQTNSLARTCHHQREKDVMGTTTQRRNVPVTFIMKTYTFLCAYYLLSHLSFILAVDFRVVLKDSHI